MNKTETEFFHMLGLRGYAKVGYEAITLEIGTGSRYTPDFFCVFNGPAQLIILYEVKNNFIREASLVRLKVAARQYPCFVFILAQKKKGVWSEKTIQP
jgi:hypothetical protein